MISDFTFVHAADIHLDSPLSGLAARDPTFSALVRGATRKAFSNVIDLAIEEGAAFVVISGDLYDGTWKDQSTGQFAVAQFARLTRAGIRAFIVYGNHDAESRITRHLTMPGGVYAFDNRQCEFKTLDDLGVVVHGRSYKNAATVENLASDYTPPIKGQFNIAMLHTALDGHTGHATYAPCRLEELRASGHDYWALGHVHDASVRSEFAHVVFSGNTQGRNIRETGAKGVMVVRVANGVVKTVQHKPTDEVRWASAVVDARPTSNMQDLLASISTELRSSIVTAGGRPTAVRLTINAAGPMREKLIADPEWLTSEVIGQASAVSDLLWIEKVKLIADKGRTGLGLPQDLAEILSEASHDPECLRSIEAAIASLVSKLPSDVGDPELTPLLTAARSGDGQTLIAAARRSVEARLEVET